VFPVRPVTRDGKQLVSSLLKTSWVAGDSRQVR
jgi:hypothetical protein